MASTLDVSISGVWGSRESERGVRSVGGVNLNLTLLGVPYPEARLRVSCLVSGDRWASLESQLRRWGAHAHVCLC